MNGGNLMLRRYGKDNPKTPHPTIFLTSYASIIIQMTMWNCLAHKNWKNYSDNYERRVTTFSSDVLCFILHKLNFSTKLIENHKLSIIHLFLFLVSKRHMSHGNHDKFCSLVMMSNHHCSCPRYISQTVRIHIRWNENYKMTAL